MEKWFFITLTGISHSGFCFLGKRVEISDIFFSQEKNLWEKINKNGKFNNYIIEKQKGNYLLSLHVLELLEKGEKKLRIDLVKLFFPMDILQG